MRENIMSSRARWRRIAAWSLAAIGLALGLAGCCPPGQPFPPPMQGGPSTARPGTVQEDVHLLFDSKGWLVPYRYKNGGISDVGRPKALAGHGNGSIVLTAGSDSVGDVCVQAIGVGEWCTVGPSDYIELTIAKIDTCNSSSPGNCNMSALGAPGNSATQPSQNAINGRSSTLYDLPPAQYPLANACPPSRVIILPDGVPYCT